MQAATAHTTRKACDFLNGNLPACSDLVQRFAQEPTLSTRPVGSGRSENEVTFRLKSSTLNRVSQKSQPSNSPSRVDSAPQLGHRYSDSLRIDWINSECAEPVKRIRRSRFPPRE